MKIKDIMKYCSKDIALHSGNPETEISAVEYDSRKISTGALFVAVIGMQSNGHDYIDSALDRGAAAVVISNDAMPRYEYLKERNVAVMASKNTRQALSSVSHVFFGFPSDRVPVLGITGTNGKTSITYLLESILAVGGYSPAVIGTVNYRWKGNNRAAPNTTPESRDLHGLMAEMISDGANVVIMEVSSHALKLDRVDDISFDIAAFTNLTQDHMDFHHDFNDYFESKIKLFHLLNKGNKKNRLGVVNIDDPYGRQIYSIQDKMDYPFLSYGIDDKADYRPVKESIRSTIQGIGYEMQEPLSGFHVLLNIAGYFNVYNSLCAVAMAHLMGVGKESILQGLLKINTVPGRFDRIESPAGFNVIVDYAHTSDALEKVLQSARDLGPKKLITVFGCGGNRDRSKRPLMGAAASKYSDHVIVTSDNPRLEDPMEIIRDILPGLGDNYEIEPDREKAIRIALDSAGEGDIVVVAGKGHEDYQIIGKEKRHFDDREIVKKYISLREEN